MDKIPFGDRQLLRFARSKTDDPVPGATRLLRLGSDAFRSARCSTTRSRTACATSSCAAARPALNEWPREARRRRRLSSALRRREPRPVPPIIGIAIGADSDNTKQHSVGYADRHRARALRSAGAARPSACSARRRPRPPARAARSRAARRRPARVTLVSPYPQTIYSGMVPGWVAGRYRARAVHDPARAAGCERPRSHFVAGRRDRHRRGARARVAAGRGRADSDYDVLSVDTGGVDGARGDRRRAEHGVFRATDRALRRVVATRCASRRERFRATSW